MYEILNKINNPEELLKKEKMDLDSIIDYIKKCNL